MTIIIILTTKINNNNNEIPNLKILNLNPIPVNLNIYCSRLIDNNEF